MRGVDACSNCASIASANCACDSVVGRLQPLVVAQQAKPRPAQRVIGSQLLQAKPAAGRRVGAQPERRPTRLDQRVEHSPAHDCRPPVDSNRAFGEHMGGCGLVGEAQLAG